MEKLTYDLELNDRLPLVIDNSAGQLFITGGCEKNYLELEKLEEVPEFGKIKFHIDKDNRIVFDQSYMNRIKVTVYLADFSGKLDINLLQGNVFIQDMACEIHLNITEGDIKIRQCTGPVTASTLKGSINVADYRGKGFFTASGGIVIKKWAEASGLVKEESGEVCVDVLSMEAKLDLQNKNNHIIIGLAKESHCTIIARAKDVLEYSVPEHPKSLGSPAKLEWQGGGQTIQAFAGLGKIKITDSRYLDKIHINFERALKELDDIFANNIDVEKLKKEFRRAGKKAGQLGQGIFNKIKKTFQSSDNEKQE